jgi:hypothetical protein
LRRRLGGGAAGVPQAAQNLSASRISSPQLVQNMPGSPFWNGTRSAVPPRVIEYLPSAFP